MTDTLGVTEVPDGITPIRAVRCWKVGAAASDQALVSPLQYRTVLADGSWRYQTPQILRPVLQSTAMRTNWTPGVVTAHCAHAVRRATEHTAPREDCYCGLYGTRDARDAWEQVGHYECHARTIIVFGEVDLWGIVAEHEWGWRAQYARIVKLYDAPGLYDLGHIPWPGLEALDLGLPIAPVPIVLRTLIGDAYARLPQCVCTRWSGEATKCTLLHEMQGQLRPARPRPWFSFPFQFPPIHFPFSFKFGRR